jgi:hypothetical protein
MNLKVRGREVSWPNWRFYPSIFLQELRKYTKIEIIPSFPHHTRRRHFLFFVSRMACETRDTRWPIPIIPVIVHLVYSHPSPWISLLRRGPPWKTHSWISVSCVFVTVVCALEYFKLYFRRSKHLWSYTSTPSCFFMARWLINEATG